MNGNSLLVVGLTTFAYVGGVAMGAYVLAPVLREPGPTPAEVPHTPAVGCPPNMMRHVHLVSGECVGAGCQVPRSTIEHCVDDCLADGGAL